MTTLPHSGNNAAFRAATLNGIYTLQGLSTADASQRNLTLVLNQDGTALFTTEFIGRGTIVERGTWTADRARAEIMLTDLDGQRIQLRLIFELRGNEMVYVGPDPRALGASELKLVRAVSE